MAHNIVYLDETGSLNLELRDKAYPLFALTMLVADQDYYARTITSELVAFKLKHFGHDGIILHSRDIRKAQGDFGMLTDPVLRQAFMNELTTLMRRLEYRWITTVVRLQDHKERYGIRAENPYDLALTFCLERLLPLLEEDGQTEVSLVAESRGTREDKELELVFLRTVNDGTVYIPGDRFRAIRFRLVFPRKCKNIIGNQLADLVCYPVARHVLAPKKPNLPYDVLRPKMYQGRGMVRGLKVFP